VRTTYGTPHPAVHRPVQSQTDATSPRHWDVPSVHGFYPPGENHNLIRAVLMMQKQTAGPAQMTSKVFVELERTRIICKAKELFQSFLISRKQALKLTQHNHTRNITAIFKTGKMCDIIIRTDAPGRRNVMLPAML